MYKNIFLLCKENKPFNIIKTAKYIYSLLSKIKQLAFIIILLKTNKRFSVKYLLFIKLTAYLKWTFFP